VFDEISLMQDVYSKAIPQKYCFVGNPYLPQTNAHKKENLVE
jgi:hypothetical protein